MTEKKSQDHEALRAALDRLIKKSLDNIEKIETSLALYAPRIKRAGKEYELVLNSINSYRDALIKRVDEFFEDSNKPNLGFYIREVKYKPGKEMGNFK